MALIALFSTHERLLEHHVLSLLTNQRGEPGDDEARLGWLVAAITSFVHETLGDLVDCDCHRGSRITFNYELYHAPLAWLMLISQRGCLDVVIVVAHGGDGVVVNQVFESDEELTVDLILSIYLFTRLHSPLGAIVAPITAPLLHAERVPDLDEILLGAVIKLNRLRANDRVRMVIVK